MDIPRFVRSGRPLFGFLSPAGSAWTVQVARCAAHGRIRDGWSGAMGMLSKFHFPISKGCVVKDERRYVLPNGH